MRRCVPIVFLALLSGTFLFRPGVLSGDGNVLGSPRAADLFLKCLPWKAFAAQSYLRCEAPLWNPYILCGEPLACEAETAAFYPPNAPFLFLPLVPAYNLCLAGHIFLAGLSGYLFVRYIGLSQAGALVSAMTFMLSAPFLVRIYAGHFSLICTMAWFPLVLLGLEHFFRKPGAGRACIAGLAWGMQILAGHPQYAFYGLVGAALYSVFRSAQILLAEKRARTALGLAGGLVLFAASGLILSAVQWLPLLPFIPLSARGGLPYGFSASYSLPPENLFTFLVPGLFGDMLESPYWGACNFWEMCAYAGILPLILAGAALCCGRGPYPPVMAALAAIGILLALGGNTPLFTLFYTFVPGFSLFRGPSKFLFLSSFSIAVLAGLGAESVLQASAGHSRRLRLFLTTGACAAAVLLAAIIFTPPLERAPGGTFFTSRQAERPGGQPKPESGEALRARFNNALRGAGRSCAIALAGFACCLLVPSLRRFGAAPALLFLAFLVCDPGYLVSRYAQVSPASLSEWDGDIVAFFKGRAGSGPFRVLSINPNRLPLNGSMYGGIENLEGCTTNALKRIMEVSNLSLDRARETFSQIILFEPRSSLPSLMNTVYLIADSTVPPGALPMKTVYSTGDLRVLFNDGALPRAFIAGEARSMGGGAAAAGELFSPRFDPRRTVLLEGEDYRMAAGEETALSSGEVRFLKASPRDILLEADVAPPGGYLVLGDAYYPGWRAYVDGVGRRVLRANYVMRAVRMEEGRHLVRFLYRPGWFYLGAAVSIAGAALASILLARARTGRRDETG